MGVTPLTDLVRKRCLSRAGESVFSSGQGGMSGFVLRNVVVVVAAQLDVRPFTPDSGLHRSFMQEPHAKIISIIINLPMTHSKRSITKTGFRRVTRFL